MAEKAIAYGHGTARILSASLGHDLVEDTDIPRSMIEMLLGTEIWDALVLLSKSVRREDPVTGETIERIEKSKDEYIAGLLAAPTWIQIVKGLDRLDNLSSMDPWSFEKQLRYIAATHEWIIPMMEKADPRIAQALVEKCGRYEGYIKEEMRHPPTRLDFHSPHGHKGEFFCHPEPKR